MELQKSLVPLELDASPLEELYPGLTFQWLFNKQAFGLYAENSLHKLVDVWADKMIEVSQSWPTDRPLFVIHDFSAKDCAVTPYSQQKNRDLVKQMSHIKVVRALVVRQNLTMQLIHLFLRTIHYNNLIQMTFSREEAIVWLKKQIDRHNAKQG